MLPRSCCRAMLPHATWLTSAAVHNQRFDTARRWSKREREREGIARRGGKREKKETRETREREEREQMKSDKTEERETTREREGEREREKQTGLRVGVRARGCDRVDLVDEND